jgi:Protein of unknown function (DUF2934)
MSATMITKPGSTQREPESNMRKPAATARASESQPSEPCMQEEIARLAYTLWQQRGCPTGSAEFDWFAAEEKLRESVERGESSVSRR